MSELIGINKLMRAREVQRLVKRYGHLNTKTDEGGHSNEWIHENIVYPKFFISRCTFYDYLKINVTQELKKIENEKTDCNAANTGSRGRKRAKQLQN